MNADQVKAYVAAKWPEAMKSPVAVACSQFTAADAADNAIGFAKLQAVATAVEDRAMREAALDYAINLLFICPDHDAESVSCHVESNFAELDLDDCDEIASKAIKFHG